MDARALGPARERCDVASESNARDLPVCCAREKKKNKRKKRGTGTKKADVSCLPAPLWVFAQEIAMRQGRPDNARSEFCKISEDSDISAGSGELSEKRGGLFGGRKGDLLHSSLPRK